MDDPTNDSSWANTLVIITADHETGYLTAGLDTFPDVPLGNVVNDTTLALEKIYSGSGGRRASWYDIDLDGDIDPNETIYWVWNSGGHSNSLVPLSARGPGADLFADFIAGNDTIRGNYVDNTDVYSVMDMVLGGSDGCLCDFDSNGVVDGSDLAFFATHFGQTNSGSPPLCEGDFDGDGDADGSDLAVFAENYGKTDGCKM